MRDPMTNTWITSFQSADFDEELIRKYLSLIDMEEFRLREKQLGPENNAANI